jgi:hypothetical protein
MLAIAQMKFQYAAEEITEFCKILGASIAFNKYIAIQERYNSIFFNAN